MRSTQIAGTVPAENGCLLLRGLQTAQTEHLSSPSRKGEAVVEQSSESVVKTCAVTAGAMLSYEGVIRKRLRLKGHPDIPSFQEELPEPPALVSSEDPAASRSDDEPAPAPAESKSDGDIHQRTDEIQPGRAEPPAVEGEDEIQKDTRTEAEKRHDEVSHQREKERLRKVAGKSYREHVEVSFLLTYWALIASIVLIARTEAVLLTPPTGCSPRNLLATKIRTVRAGLQQAAYGGA